MLAGSVALAMHFTAHELGVDVPEATNAIVENAKRVALWLETVRGLLDGRRVFITSGYRTPKHNQEIGGSDGSDHVVGLAADFEVEGLTPFQVYRRLSDAQSKGLLPPFDQLIYYALDNHIHVGLGPKMRGEVLLKTAEGSYVALAGSYLSKLRGYV